MPQATIGIIGAGITGLSCAQQLQQVGQRVILWEKSRGAGGRVATRRIEPNLSFDHGAQYFTVRSDAMQSALEDWLDRGIVREWSAPIVKLHQQKETATSPQKRYVAVPGMSALGRELAQGLNIQLNQRVTRIRYDKPHWYVETEDGPPSDALDRLIITLPSQQTRDLLQASGQPCDRLPDVTLAPCWAGLFAWEKPLPGHFGGAFVDASPLAWIARNSSKPGRPTSKDNPECWVVHASPDWSRTHLEHPAEAIQAPLLAALQEATGWTIPMPIFAQAHRWRFSIGSHSSESGALELTETGLIVAGDWLNGGRVEGAYLAGLRAAELVRTPA